MELVRSAQRDSFSWEKDGFLVRVPHKDHFSGGLDMGQVFPFVRREAAFDPEATAILIAACQTAIQRFGDRRQSAALRGIAARRIIALATKGEHNPERLCAAALATIRRTQSAACGTNSNLN
jgi:hypothetical protein